MKNINRLQIYQILSVMGLLVGIFLPEIAPGFSICLFYNLTALPCPACGLTRSVSSLLHGDLMHSLMYHPMGIVVLAIMAVLAVSIFFRKSNDLFFRYEVKIYFVFYAFVSVVFVFGFVRGMWIALSPETSIHYFYSFPEKSIFTILKNFIF